MVDLTITSGRRVASHATSDQRDTLGVVVGGRTFCGFPFGQDDQCRTVDVEVGVHAGCALFASGECESHVCTISHSVDGKSSENGFDNFFLGVYVVEAKCFGRFE